MRLRPKDLQPDEQFAESPHSDQTGEPGKGSGSADTSITADSRGIDPPGSEPQDKRGHALEGRRKKDSLGSAARLTLGGGLFALMVFFIAMFLFGFRTYAITGGSMSGTIDRGALIVDRIVPVNSLKVDDIITFRPPGQRELVTHRIASVESSEGGQTVFRTKGDANETVDPWQFTLDSDRQARYVFHIPYLGYALLVFGAPLVRSALLGTLALLLVFSLFLSLWRQAGETPPHPSTVPADGVPSEPDDNPDDSRPPRRMDRRG